MASATGFVRYPFPSWEAIKALCDRVRVRRLLQLLPGSFNCANTSFSSSLTRRPTPPAAASLIYGTGIRNRCNSLKTHDGDHV
jgi:hypothetical protein